ncbi:nuclear transport factor 2 family protein [Lacticaseibacillus rhamnosus]|uniref:nuclear transport factor 2 family protein n=1 Tax=Lacticaseibacillus rhamnosus TaxID=47715 RepID=UPI0005E4B854|nr:nuclear transport factor 2 family protein [Lacticaseibacillus rhamnosus]OAT93528.1 hypothetical protein PY94_10130 [Lacticaseibacillus rhamnosus]CDN23499.1 SnoaL-like domain protein [Lacticaseibacillus rhamnosus]
MTQNCIEQIKHYFALSDQASKDLHAREQILSLFSDNAKIIDAQGQKHVGKNAITQFFDAFFERNLQLRHLAKPQLNDQNYSAEWAVAGEKKDGHLFTLHGKDVYQFNSEGKIQFCQVIAE